MLRMCCCCFLAENHENSERQPLLHNDPGGYASARSARLGRSDAPPVNGKLVMKRVGVQELDQRFYVMAETFNEQHEHYENMVRHIRNVQQIYGCNSNDTLALTECVMKIREEHAHCRVSVKLIGHDFSLTVVPLGSAGGLSPQLKFAQGEFKNASDSAKATISKGPAIQEMIGWLLHTTEQMAEQVKGAAATYQDQRRLTENLERNVTEVQRARDLSQGYRQRVTQVHSEIAQIAEPIS